MRSQILKSALLWIIHFIMTVHTYLQYPPYELIHMYSTFNITELSGLIELTCREGSTAEELPVSNINIWLNRSSVNDPDLRERKDVGAVEVHGCCRLRFNLTHQLGGNFTCGIRTDVANVKESPPKMLICKYLAYHCINDIPISLAAIKDVTMSCKNKYIIYKL